MGMKGMEGTAYFQFSPMVLRVSHREGITMADAPSYAPLMPSSRADWTMEHRKAGQYSLARRSSVSAPQAPMGTKPMEWISSSGV